MEVETMSRSLVPVQGGRNADMVGGFHLDDHNVEEWTDSTTPGLQHHAREEKGKWINPERNADIHYQKREDNKKFERGEEKQKTEVIEGKSPESNFQIVRTHRQFQDEGDTSGGSGSRVTSSSTMYQMSSSRGMRSTVKTTSNKTTSKTVTVSGGRTDDFENLKMSFQPLDNSTQRERINMCRSGTMGSRRPPTKIVRKHVPAVETETEHIDNGISESVKPSDDSVGGLSILGYKNLSPKIRVGFPVEIQLELQTKLRVSSTTNGEIGDDDNDSIRNRPQTRLPSSFTNRPSNASGNFDWLHGLETNLEQKPETRTCNNDSATPLENNRISNNEESTFDFRQRRKSYGFESFDPHLKLPEVKLAEPGAPNPNNCFKATPTNGLLSTSTPGSPMSQQKRTPLHSLSRSWDLIQNIANCNTSSHQRSKDSLETIPANESKPRNLSPVLCVRKEEFDWNDGSDGELQQEFTFDSLEDASAKRMASSIVNIQQPTPNGANYDSSASQFSPTSERSRKLMKMLDETPDILNKMSFKNYLSSASLSQENFKPEEIARQTWNVRDDDNNTTEKNKSADWERQKRQLNFLSDSLNRILVSSSEASDNGRSHLSERNRLNAKTAELGEGISNHSSEKETNFVFSAQGRSPQNEYDTTDTHYPLEDDGPGQDEDMEVDYNSNVRRPSQVSHTWISSGDLDKPIQQVRDQDVTTTISATYDSFRKPFKKVEFCKTEVHFTADSGRFHIVETDENKPSTVHLYRRKRRNEKKTSDLLKSLEFDGLQRSNGLKDGNSKTEDEKHIETGGQEENIAVTFRHHWNEEQKNRASNFSEKKLEAATNRSAESESKGHHARSESLLNELTAAIKPMQSPPEVNDFTINDDEKIKLLDKNSRLMMNLNLNLALDVGDIDGDNDDDLSPSHNILSKYGELKIQRYLKQLTSPSSLSLSETSEMSLDPDMNPIDELLGQEDSSQFRFDNNVLYENGSFVPMATRKSLIEMNNRNRKRSSQTSASHTSENSSTGSNYSLPNSETNLKSEHRPLKLTAMEATVRTAGPKPQITSVELRYSMDDDVDRKREHDTYHPKPYMPEPIIVPQISRENSREERGKVFQRHIPFAVMPPEISNPPYRNGHYSFTPSRSPSKSPTRDNAAFRNPKPPTPVLPIQFSTFEKTGAALRERFYSKNPSCSCTGELEPESNLPTLSLLGENSGLRNSTRYSDPIRIGTVPSKSIVTIAHDNMNYGDRSGINNIDFADTKARQNVNNILEDVLKANHEDEGKSAALTPEPIISMGLDHTWKGPAHFENQSSTKGTSLTRSMTFPKSTRPEPEWVSKARSRENRVTDWNLVGKPYGSNRKSEPPWISEIRFKNKTNSTEEIKSLPKISIVYPWQRETNANVKNKESGRIAQGDPQTTVSKSLTSVLPKREAIGTEISTQRVDNLPSWKSNPSELSTSTGNNKSIVDLNRDSDSILFNPPQIEVKPTETTSRHKSLKSKHLSSDRHERLASASASPDNFHSSTNPKSLNGVKGFNAVDNSLDETLSSSRKPLQSSTINNKSNKESSKSKAPPKPPKPPQRTSSLVKTQASAFSASPEKKPPRRVIYHQNVSEESPCSSRSNTPIHRHPTVKVAKLPLRNSPHAPSPDGKASPSKNKTKTHVSLEPATKRTDHKTKQHDSTVTTNMKSTSPIQNQNQSPTPGGKMASWSNAIKNQARQAPSLVPSNKKLI